MAGFSTLQNAELRELAQASPSLAKLPAEQLDAMVARMVESEKDATKLQQMIAVFQKEKVALAEQSQNREQVLQEKIAMLDGLMEQIKNLEHEFNRKVREGEEAKANEQDAKVQNDLLKQLENL